MSSEYIAGLKESAEEAADMNRKDPGSGYAYAIGVVTAIAESKHTENADKVERIRIFLREFKQSKGDEKGQR